jgi:hypothetical protein
MKAEYWEARFPVINWREPIVVHWDDRQAYSCRICIAEFGLKKESAHQWRDVDQVMAHIGEVHS